MPKHNLYVDSSQRSLGSTSSTDFEIILRKPVSRARKVYLFDCAIPFTYFTINSTNNYFQMVYDNGVPIIAGFTLSPGNYNSTTILPAIQTSLDILFGAGAVVVSIDAPTSRFIFTATVGTVELRAADIAVNTLGQTLGFTVPVGPFAVIIGDQVYNLSGPNRLFIHSTKLQSTDTLKTQPSQNVGTAYSSCIGTVIVDVNSGGLIRSLVPNPSLLLDGRDIAEIDFQLKYADGTIVDLNGANWTLQLCFESR